jgi:polar amino acid transport system substrate-binding protein
MFAAARLISGLASAATLAEVKKRGYMVVVTEDDFRPLNTSRTASRSGYDNETHREPPQIRAVRDPAADIPWTGLLAGVSTGKHDIAVTAAIVTRSGSNRSSGRPLGIQAGSGLLQHLPQLKAKLETMDGRWRAGRRGTETARGLNLTFESDESTPGFLPC